MPSDTPAAPPARDRRWSQWSDDGVARLAGARYRLGRGEPAVALTFDDGPDPEFTPLVLDALASAGARATFFVLGRHAETYPDLVRRAHAEGHRIGTHSQTHPKAAGAHHRLLIDDYRAGRASVQDILGVPVPLFRPPHGRITPAVAMAVRRLSLDVWLWTVNTDDWRSGTTPQGLLDQLDEVSAGDVVVFHDATAEQRPGVSTDRSATIEALAGVVDLVRTRGMTFATL